MNDQRENKANNLWGGLPARTTPAQQLAHYRKAVVRAVNPRYNWLMALCLMVSASAFGFAQSSTVTGTVVSQSQNPDKKEVHETYPLADGGVVSLSNLSGNVRVTSWNEARVQLDAVKRARNESDWQQVAIEINARPNMLEVRTVYPRGKSNSTAVDYELKVPRTAVLNAITSTSGDVTLTGPIAKAIARSTSGNVTVRDISGDATLNSTSGNVIVEHIGGALSVGSTSGNMTIRDVAARLTARASSGNIQASQIRDDANTNSASGNIRLEEIGGRVNAAAMSGWVNVRKVGGDVTASSTSDNVVVEDVRGRVTASAISGNVTIKQADEGARGNSISGNILFVQTKGRLEAETISGSITLQNVDAHDLRLKSLSSGVSYQGPLYGDGRYELQSHSGDVVLMIPADSEFNLSAQTFSGSVNTEFPLQLSSGSIGARGPVRGMVGKGGAQVNAVTFSGSVNIKKMNASAKQ